MPPRAPGSARKKGGGVDKRAPRRSERERGRESADRRVLPHSERGKGEARGLSARSGPRHWAACASRAGVGCWADNSPKLGVSAGLSRARVWGWAKVGEGIKIKGKLFYIFQSCKVV